ncbi:MAG TPA: DUF4282 domain-containing protein [Polyangiaceae bacterium]|jgi:hypothetical protein
MPLEDAAAEERHVWMVRGADGRDVGPVSTSQIAQARAAGKLDARASVRHMTAGVWENLDAFMARARLPPQEGSLPSFEGVDEVTLQAPSAPLPAPKPPGAEDTARRRAIQRAPVRALLDFTFTSFLTTRIVGALYGLVLLLAAGLLLASECLGFAAIVGAVRSSQEGMDSPSVALGFGLLLVLGGPVASVFVVVSGRVALEFVVVTFRIADTLEDIKTKTR